MIRATGLDALENYVANIQTQLESGHAREHAYRPALQQLMGSFEDVLAVNDPKRSENGNPDFIFLKTNNRDVILGYAEAKDITIDLDKTVKTEQLRRYAGYEKLYLTNYVDFRFYQNGEEYERISIGKLTQGRLIVDRSQFERLLHELEAFLSKPPESIRSGKRLALIMGGKARRIRDNVALYLGAPAGKDQELQKIYDLMRQMLVHDLTTDKFADMYAQTLVYGLFVARYNDKTPESFDRKEARDLVPKSNPFLRHFFDHIVGPDFDSRLAHIVDELCEVFSVSDVKTLIQKHLRLFEVENEKDPIIHFYEDFLQEYDPVIRKQMGAYYTPIPVVQFIVRQVDDILKRDFDITNGLADSSTITKQVDIGQEVEKVRLSPTGKQMKYRTSLIDREFHRVQILDPAVGTATFLNETIKHIARSFKGQEGQWPSYVQDHLLDRLHGFELMMAPYTIAHLKLGMTLQETGVDDFSKRLGVYLTNTLESGGQLQQDLLSFGLAQAVSDESQAAGEIKNERPIMVIMGNPPYSINSNNLTSEQRGLITKYKYVDDIRISERGAIRFEMNLNDDYIKFLAFTEDLVARNGEGIVAMINNHNYIDAPTFRGVRNHLMKTFDKIYILDLHGSNKKSEMTVDGTKDENVFDIEAGVCVNIFIKYKNGSADSKSCEVYRADVYGTRSYKFDYLNKHGISDIDWTKLEPRSPTYEFIVRDYELLEKYQKFIKFDELMSLYSSGIISANDKMNYYFSKVESEDTANSLQTLSADDIEMKYGVRAQTKSWALDRAITDARSLHGRNASVIPIAYRPFDFRYAYYTGQPMGLMNSPRYPIAKHVINKDNYGLCLCRQYKTGNSYQHVLITETMVDIGYISNRTSESGSIFPLWIYHSDGTRTANLNQSEVSKLLKNLKPYCYVDEESDLPGPQPDYIITAVDILDYVYGVLYSPGYRKKYNEFLKTDFPRVPAPVDILQFEHFAEFGKQLRELHLMANDSLKPFTTTYPVAGDSAVEKIAYESDKIYINDVQHFGNIPESVWGFQIGGYQPAQKWLKDRKGRRLTSDDIEHYQKIIKILDETIKIMEQIDNEGDDKNI